MNNSDNVDVEMGEAEQTESEGRRLLEIVRMARFCRLVLYRILGQVWV